MTKFKDQALEVQDVLSLPFKAVLLEICVVLKHKFLRPIPYSSLTIYMTLVVIQHFLFNPFFFLPDTSNIQPHFFCIFCNQHFLFNPCFLVSFFIIQYFSLSFNNSLLSANIFSKGLKIMWLTLQPGLFTKWFGIDLLVWRLFISFRC